MDLNTAIKHVQLALEFIKSPDLIQIAGNPGQCCVDLIFTSQVGATRSIAFDLLEVAKAVESGVVVALVRARIEHMYFDTAETGIEEDYAQYLDAMNKFALMKLQDLILQAKLLLAKLLPDRQPPRCTTSLALRPGQYLQHPLRCNTYLSSLQEGIMARDADPLTAGEPLYYNNVAMELLGKNVAYGMEHMGDDLIIENEGKGE